MTERLRTVKWLTVFLLCIAVFGLTAGGCAKKGSSGLTFIEFFDPT